jgi:hypothetical protein
MDVKLIRWVVVCSLLTFASCLEPDPIYEVEPVTVQEQGGQKKGFKSDRQFVSGAFSDLFGKQITSAELDESMVCYNAISDKGLVRDMIIRDMLRRNSLVVPAAQDMRNDKDKFIIDTYRKFYKRDPSDLEKWTLLNQIDQDTTLNPVLIYYAFLSSEEYLYY